jgi:AraC family transcriptional regulator, regulatory protein of adaptative response / methylated-DNA-[protein]-cysteine methyltransferase
MDTLNVTPPRKTPRRPSQLKAQAASADVLREDPRWQAVVNRDRSQDGRFFYSVATTGVYCRPSCGARLAKPQNVAFHETTNDAERAGFRACKRCRPADFPSLPDNVTLITAVCRRIENSEEPPSLAQLAQQAKKSPSYLQRLFKQVVGVSPAHYARSFRAQRVVERLRQNTSVTAAIYDAGYQSSGRFYAESNGLLGMTPSTFKSGGASTTIHFAIGQCSLGAALVAETTRGVCAILLGESPQALIRELEQRFPRSQLVGDDPALESRVAMVVSLVDNPTASVSLPLDIQGTAFQRKVWQALQKIPPGETRTYSQIADAIGSPQSVRAVGSACGANPVAVAVPCHRVIRNDGALGGYRWGLQRKQALLDKESDSRRQATSR